MPSTQVRELRDELRVDVAHAHDERDDGGHHLDEAQRGDYSLEPCADLVEIRSEGGGDLLARSHRHWLQRQGRLRNSPVATLFFTRAAWPVATAVGAVRPPARYPRRSVRALRPR